MNESLKSGQWYRLELPLEKVFIAEYTRSQDDNEGGWFIFPDGSRKEAGDILPYLASLIEIDEPDLSGEFNIAEFFEE